MEGYQYHTSILTIMSLLKYMDPELVILLCVCKHLLNIESIRREIEDKD